MVHRRKLIIGGLACAGLPTLGGALAQEQGQDTSSVWAPHIIELAEPFPPAGEVHVMPGPFRLYWTLPAGRAIVYPVRIGRGDLYEAGEYFIGAKKEWPSWVPTPDMVKREPEKYAQYAETGMAGGVGNPLGARALYLFTVERGDTFLRIHGTDDSSTIGRAVSNGCAGLTNEHMVDLYDRVPLDAKVFLHPKPDDGGFTHDLE
ncbi:L,D-transpeptidase [Roseibium aggregatum]|uniref:L,D-transpeptidase n=1 Tax=Roseibium aggregatum TaxID=187304 RepID=A0A939EBQ5_9HYPH|nr:L,D-transpeptidase [Roseibium aggregatum]MBN9670235.1 L,D-transpeptidase [Roseibium aggregatum]